MLTNKIQLSTLQNLMTKKFKTYFEKEIQQLTTHKLIIFKQMQQCNNDYCESTKAYLDRSYMCVSSPT